MMRISRPLWLLLLCAVAQSAACGDSRTDEQMYKDALANIEGAKYRAAVIDLKNLLQKNPDDRNARLALGRATLQLGDPVAAEKELLRARDLGANPNDFAALLARVMLARGAYAELLSEMNDTSVSDSATAGIIESLRGNAQLGLGSLDDARATFDAVIAAEPDPEAVRLALLGKAELAKRSANLTDAEAFVRRSLEFVPDSAESTLALGQMLMLQNKHVQAEEVFRWGSKELTTSPINQYMLHAGLVESLLGQDKTDEAATASDALVALSPEHPMTGYLKGRVAFQQGDLDTAVEKLQGVVAKFPNYQPAQTLLGATSLQRGDLEQAEMFLSSALAANPRNSAARGLLAETRLKMRRPDDAVATIKDGLRNDEGSPELLALLGQATAAQGNQEDGIRYLETSFKANPSPQIALALASAYIANGQSAEAAALVEGLPEGAMDPRRKQVLLIMSRFDRSNPAAAVAEVDQLIEQWPDDTAVIAFAGSFYLQNREFAKARRSFDRVLEMEPLNRAAILNLGRLDQAEGNFDSSKAHFEAYLAANPDDLLTLMALARIAEKQNDRTRSLALIQQANSAHPEALMPNLALAGHALQTGDLGGAERHARAAVNGNPTVAAAHSSLSFYHLRANEWQDALASARKAVELEPNFHLYRAQLARAQAGVGRLAQARESFLEALKLKPDHLPSARGLALLDIKAGRVSDAEALLARLKRDYAEQPAVLEIEGDVRAAQGKFAEATVAYAAAADIQPSRALAIKRYNILSRNGLPNAADTLRKWLERSPDDVAARLLLAQEFQRAGNGTQAIEQYELIVDAQPKNALALNNLAWLHFEQTGTDSRVRALELSGRAHQLAPRNSDVADTHGWILVKSGRLDEGRDVLESALAASDPESSPDVAYHLAATLQETGDRDRAKTLLRAALNSKRRFHSRADAQTLHDSL